MSERTAWFLVGVGGILAIVVWKWGNPIVAAQIAENWAANLVGRGNALSQSTLSNGVIEEIPSVLVDMATAVLGFQADPDTLSLARMGRSEGVDGEEYRMHVLLNDLADLQRTYGTGVYSSITALLTHSNHPPVTITLPDGSTQLLPVDGHYSAQNLGKRYSTAHDPYESDYALAQKVMADHAEGNDPTGGAIKFVDKSGPFYVDGQKTDYDGLVAAWAQNGLTPDDSLPNATTNFVVFRRTA